MVDKARDDTRAGQKPALSLSRLSLLDGLWLLLLSIYVLAGMSLAPFHGDETNHIFNSHDFAVLFIHHQPDRLLLTPPYEPETPEYFRVLDATLPRYAFGLAWSLSGLSEAELPSGPWLWAMDYTYNLAQNRVPSEQMLNSSRLVSSLFLCLSISIMFGLGRQFGERPLAYLVSGLYALNPLVLLNGRRAMQEGLLLCCGLLTILIAAIISKKREQNRNNLGGWWIGLTVAASLALGSKNSGLLYIAGAYGWLFITDLLHKGWRSLAETTIKLSVSGLIAVAIWVMLSPGLWHRPLAGLTDIVAERRKAMQMQVDVNPDAPTTIAERAAGLATQPFLTPAQYYEVPFWADFVPITDQINRYEASHLDGLHFGLLLGIPLTIMACLGIGVTFWPRLRPYPSQALATGLTVWLGVMSAAALINPLPWQRYYLSLIPVMSLLAGIGLWALFRRMQQLHRKSGIDFVDSSAA